MGRKKVEPAAVLGGKARAEKLSSGRRTAIAQLAALARWANAGKNPPILAKYGAPDRPLRIAEIEIPCYVLANGSRVLAQRGLHRAIGLSEGGGKEGANKVVSLLEMLQENGVPTGDLVARCSTPLRFIPPHGGTPALGYDATILPDICAVLIRAGQGDKRFHRLAQQAAVLQHGFATVGIIALVDEATGYQDFRARDALAKILERFVAKEMRPWVKTFPPDYYRQIYRLNGWAYDDQKGKPSVLGHWTNNIVYRRLAPGVLDELRRVTPRDDRGRLKHKLFQRLTEEVGHPKLREHLAGVLMLMKYAPDWQVFMDRLDQEYPQWGKTLMLPYPDDFAAPEV